MPEMQQLVDWIIAEGLSAVRIDSVLEGVSQRLMALGYPLLRASIAMPSIDPLQRGVSVVWQRSGALSREIQGHDDASQVVFQRSPISFLLSQDLRFGRWRLRVRQNDPSLPLLDELAEMGATDYLMKLVAFPGGTALAGAGFSLATDAPDGFSDEQIADLDRFLPALALACYRIAAMRVATDVLAVYTGSRTSDRILNGQTRRGDGSAIYAAILLADLKNFTSLNERYPPDRIVEWLNEHFDAIGDPVEAGGGEILKFMGDGLLAIFPAEIEDPADACRRALKSARSAIEGNAVLNRTRRKIGEPAIELDIVLHIGEVFYGNIGASRRLDFTTIGRAVNEAARMEKLCDTVGRSLLASAPFVSHVEDVFENVGCFDLKGVTIPAEVFSPTR